MLGSLALASDPVTWQERFMEQMRFFSLSGQAAASTSRGVVVWSSKKPTNQGVWGSPESRCCSGALQMALGQASRWVQGRLRQIRHPPGAWGSWGSGTLPKHCASPQRSFWASGLSFPSSVQRTGFLTASGCSGASQEVRGWALP